MALTKQASDLIVNWTQINPRTHKTVERLASKIGMRFIPDAGWHVSVMYDGEYHTCLINPFARKLDAELAKSALDKAGLNTAKAMVKAGRIRCLQVAYEALQW